MVFGTIALNRKRLEKMDYSQLFLIVKDPLETFCNVGEIGGVAFACPGAQRAVVEWSGRGCIKKRGAGRKRMPGKTNKIHVPGLPRFRILRFNKTKQNCK